jgi:hypothetical protein
MVKRNIRPVFYSQRMARVSAPVSPGDDISTTRAGPLFAPIRRFVLNVAVKAI